MRLYHKPFEIGLRPLEVSDWFDIDDKRADYLAQKDHLYAHDPSLVFLAEENTEQSQGEIAAAVSSFLINRYPQRYLKEGDVIHIDGVDVVPFNDPSPPLLAAARLVQDDLVIMRADEGSWRVVAGSICFPSSWSLKEKFGKALEDVHAPVPGFGAQTRNAAVINRIFERLAPDQRVWRQNWGLYDDDELHHSSGSEARLTRLANVTVENLIIRVERQTLWKMPRSGDVLFAIRIYLDRLSNLQNSDRTRILAKDLSRHLLTMTKDQLAYKGLAQARDHLIFLLGS